MFSLFPSQQPQKGDILFCFRIGSPKNPLFLWVNRKGDRPSVAVPLPSPEMASQLIVLASARDLIFRDPYGFAVGKIHNHVFGGWEEILPGQHKRDEIFQTQCSRTNSDIKTSSSLVLHG